MKHAVRTLAVICVLLHATPAIFYAQESASIVSHSFGLRGGYTFSAGDWNKVPSAPDVNLISPGMSIGGNLDIYLGRSISVGFGGDYQFMSGKDWEAYAQAAGDNLTSEATLTHLSLYLGIYLKKTTPDFLRLELGPALAFRSGSQKIDGKTYKYDFYDGTCWGVAGAVEYDRLFADQFAFSVRVATLILPSGVSYASGEEKAIILIPASAGIRTYF